LEIEGIEKKLFTLRKAQKWENPGKHGILPKTIEKMGLPKTEMKNLMVRKTKLKPLVKPKVNG